MKFFTLLALAILCAASTHGSEITTFPVGGLTFTRPADWVWVPVTSPMRKAHLKVQEVKTGEAADITFFHFGTGSGGDLASNAQRWLGQFTGKPDSNKTEPLVIGGTKVTLVTTEGAFSNTMPGGPAGVPLQNSALLGAIIEQADGNVFVKMTGPAELVKSSREKFLAFIAAALSAKK